MDDSEPDAAAGGAEPVVPAKPPESSANDAPKSSKSTSMSSAPASAPAEGPGAAQDDEESPQASDSGPNQSERPSEAPKGVRESPPPPPGAPVSAPGAAEAPSPYETQSFEIPPADITVVRTAEELHQALDNRALDVEVRDHIDLRTLNFTRAPEYGLVEGNCTDGYGTLKGSCAFLMYMEFTRSLRGNCDGPPTQAQAIQMNLPDSAVADLKAVPAGQCLMIIDKSTFLALRYNKWFDNLRFAMTSENLQPRTATAVTTTSTLTNRDHSPNAFFTRVSFHVMGGFSAAQAFAIPEQDPLLETERIGWPASRVDWQNNGHSVLFQDCEFSGFRGDNPPLLIASDSHAAFHSCTFNDLDLSVEIFDVSYGGAVHFQDCEFHNLELRRIPPKFVSTTLNDDLACGIPNTDLFRYHPEDDDYYDVDPEYIDPNDPSKGLYLDNATMSDCMRPIHFCQLDWGVHDAHPGCPPESAEKRRFMNHNVCGYTNDPDDPKYYDESDVAAYHTYGSSDYSYYDGQFAKELDYEDYEYFRPPEAQAPRPGYTEDCRPIGQFDAYDPTGNLRSVGNVQHGFLTEDHPWLNVMKESLPANLHEGEEPWAWPQVAYRSLEDRQAMLTSPPLQAPSSSSACSNSCFTALFTVMTLILCILCAVVLLLWRRFRNISEDGAKSARNTDLTFGNPLATTDVAFDWDTGHHIYPHPSYLREELQTDAMFHTAVSTSSTGEDTISYTTQGGGWFGLSTESRANFFAVAAPSGGTIQRESSGSANESSNVLVKQKSSLSSCQNENYTYQLNPGLSLAGANRLEDSELPNLSNVGPVERLPAQERTAAHSSHLPPQLAEWLQCTHTSERAPSNAAFDDTVPSGLLKPPLHVTSASEMSQQPTTTTSSIPTVNTQKNQTAPISSQNRVLSPADYEAVASTSYVHSTGTSSARETCSTANVMTQQCEFSHMHTNPVATSLQGSTEHATPLDTLASVPAIGLNVKCTDTAASEGRLRHLNMQLDRFKLKHSFLEQYHILGRKARRHGGQAVVQFARRTHDGREFAVKFFVDSSSFYTEVALYTAYFPTLRKQLKREPEACPWLLEPNSSDRELQTLTGVESINTGRIAGARFLPHVEAVCDSAEAGLVDPRGHALPPCIVMERGESLQEWSDRADPDRFTSFSVLANVSLRMKDMHEAGYAHRDLKPANVILLPRENRWTVIDFGCAARIGGLAPLAFTLTYSPPEVMIAAEARETHMQATAAVDVWALGVIAYELLTGAPAFRIVTDGIIKVLEGLRGEADLPWEGELSTDVRKRLGALHDPIMAMLSRDPDLRPSMKEAHESIIGLERC